MKIPFVSVNAAQTCTNPDVLLTTTVPSDNVYGSQATITASYNDGTASAILSVLPPLPPLTGFAIDWAAAGWDWSGNVTVHMCCPEAPNQFTFFRVTFGGPIPGAAGYPSDPLLVKVSQSNSNVFAGPFDIRIFPPGSWYYDFLVELKRFPCGSSQPTSCEDTISATYGGLTKTIQLTIMTP